MKTRTLTGGFAAVLLVALMTGKARAEDKKDKPAAFDPAKVEELMKKFASPGRQHEQFKRLAGMWKTETKSWYPNPQEPNTTAGTAKFTVLLGGRYLRQDFRGEHEGQKFMGMGLTGYDKAQKKYVGIWIDNHGTGIMHSEGTYDAKTHTMTEHGASATPLGEMKMKMVSEYLDDNKFLFTMYTLTPDGEQKVMEITYTREKSGDDAKKKR